MATYLLNTPPLQNEPPQRYAQRKCNIAATTIRRFTCKWSIKRLVPTTNSMGAPSWATPKTVGNKASQSPQRKTFAINTPTVRAAKTAHEHHVHLPRISTKPASAAWPTADQIGGRPSNGEIRIAYRAAQQEMNRPTVQCIVCHSTLTNKLAGPWVCAMFFSRHCPAVFCSFSTGWSPPKAKTIPLLTPNYI